MTACLDRRDAIHRLLDDELETAEREALHAHLRSCAACRELLLGLESTRAALRAIPQEPLPAEALDAVWKRTIRAEDTARVAPRAAWWWAAAAAAAVTVAILGALVRAPELPPAGRPAATGAAVITAADLGRAEREARLVLALTSRALRRSGNAARDEVLGARVAPALRKIPIRWAEDSSSDPRRKGT